MKETILRDYFENKIPVEELSADVKNTQVRATYDTISVHVEQINNETKFSVRKEHLLKLCSDTLQGKLNSEDINSIALALAFSEYFVWDSDTKDGEIIDNVIHDWDSPEINFPITLSNIKLWKEYLETGNYRLK